MEEKKKNLKEIYDAINKIARNCEQRGIDISNWFYTHKDIERVRKDNSKIFI